MGEHRHTRSKCETVRESFLPMMENELKSEVVVAIEAHLSECPHCAHEWGGYRSTVELLRGLEPLEVPHSVIQRIRARIHRPSVWKQVAQWILPTPQRLPIPVLATISMMLIVVGILRWSPWSTPGHEEPSMRVAPKPTPSPIIDAIQASAWEKGYQRRILPGAEELMRPVRALEDEQERRLATRATLQDDLVLDASGSEEVFREIQEILREVHGKMFLMGIRHRRSGRVIRSRVVLQVPMEHYGRIVQRIESLGHVHHLFMDRDAVPLPPDRLRIRILAVAAALRSNGHSLKEVSLDE